METIRLKMPNMEKMERIDFYEDYIKKLESLMSAIKVTGFDPGFQIGFYEKYYAGEGKIKVRIGMIQSLSFRVVHEILKSHGLHNKDIEIEE